MQGVIFLMKSTGTILNQVKWKGNKFGENEFAKKASLPPPPFSLFFFFFYDLFYHFLCLPWSFCKQPSSSTPSSSVSHSWVLPCIGRCQAPVEMRDVLVGCRHLAPLLLSLQYWKCLQMNPLPRRSHNSDHWLGEEIKAGEKKRNKTSRPGNIFH